MKQLALNFFPKKQTALFDLSWKPNPLTERSVYARREKDSKTGKITTFISVGGLNFLGNSSDPVFRFTTDSFGERQRVHEDVIPEIEYMDLDDIKAFVNKVIENNEKGYYVWDYEQRKHVFTLTPDIAAAEASEKYAPYWDDRYNEIMEAKMGVEAYREYRHKQLMTKIGMDEVETQNA